MRCNKCGYKVEDDKAFCPVCGAPMKVTADYDYIQAEIGNKVDQYINSNKYDPTLGAAGNISNTEPVSVTVVQQQSKRSANSDGLNVIGGTFSKSNSGASSRRIDDSISMAKTKNMYSRDTIYDEDDYDDDYDDEPDEEYEDDYEDEEEEYEERRPRRRVRVRYREDDYDDYDDDYDDYDDDGGRKSKIIIVAIIVAAIALIFVVLALLGVFNKKPQEVKEDVISCSVSNGGSYTLPVTITLASQDGNRLFYTTDGTEPSISSSIYTDGIKLEKSDESLVKLRVASYTQSSMKAGELVVEFNVKEEETTTTQKETTTRETTTRETETTTIDDSIFYADDEDETEFTVTPQDEGNYNVSSITAYNSVLSMLASYGYIADYNGNTYDGGFADISYQGTFQNENYTFHIFNVTYYDAAGNLSYSEYYGVGVNYGTVYSMSVYDGVFYVN